MMDIYVCSRQRMQHTILLSLLAKPNNLIHFLAFQPDNRHTLTALTLSKPLVPQSLVMQPVRLTPSAPSPASSSLF